MATTPRGDDTTLRQAVLDDLARRIVRQRSGAATKPVPLRKPARLTARPMPLRQGEPVR